MRSHDIQNFAGSIGMIFKAINIAHRQFPTYYAGLEKSASVAESAESLKPLKITDRIALTKIIETMSSIVARTESLKAQAETLSLEAMDSLSLLTSMLKPREDSTPTLTM